MRISAVAACTSAGIWCGQLRGLPSSKEPAAWDACHGSPLVNCARALHGTLLMPQRVLRPLPIGSHRRATLSDLTAYAERSP